MSVLASGRYCNEPDVLIISGSKFVTAVGFGNCTSGSRNHCNRFWSCNTSAPATFTCTLICSQVSFWISDAEHCMADFPYTIPGTSQSDMSTERMPPTLPSPNSASISVFQNCFCEIDVSAHGESAY